MSGKPLNLLREGLSWRDIVSTWESFSGFFLSASHPVVAAESCQSWRRFLMKF
jgi:hypothetical protein